MIIPDIAIFGHVDTCFVSLLSLIMYMKRRTVKRGGVKVKSKKKKIKKNIISKKVKKKGVGKRRRPRASTPSDLPPARNMAEQTLLENLRKIETEQSRIIEDALDQLRGSLDQLELLKLSKELQKL